MAFKIYAEEKKYPGDEGYQPADNLQLSDYHKWIIKKRIEADNRRWMSNKVAEWIAIGFILLILIGGMFK